jgi:gliding motility-associated-like protein
LNLTVKPKIRVEIYDTICEGTNIEFNNNTYAVAGGYSYTTQSEVTGCDSTTTLHLFVNPRQRRVINAIINQGDVYTENGFNENMTGTYVHTLQTYQGCDSIVTLNLIVHPVLRDTIKAEICQGEVYTAKGFNATTTGVYVKNIKNPEGQDTILTLELTVDPTYTKHIETSICQGDEYYFSNKALNKAGVYYDTLQTVKGCDSIIVLNLTVTPKYNDTITATISIGDNYIENNFNESMPGTYTQYLQTVNGCDSLVTLVLRNSEGVDIYVPSAFNPSEQNSSDNTFHIITGLPNARVKTFKIMNRWGTVVFSTSDIKQGWDGKYKGKLCPQGVYTYFFLYYFSDNPDEVFKKAGELMLLY